MMETKKEDYAALTLDFWDNEVIYGGKAYKAGSIPKISFTVFLHFASPPTPEQTDFV